jgi:hypothetical protein
MELTNEYIQLLLGDLTSNFITYAMSSLVTLSYLLQNLSNCIVILIL